MLMPTKRKYTRKSDGTVVELTQEEFNAEPSAYTPMEGEGVEELREPKLNPDGSRTDEKGVRHNESSAERTERNRTR
jgi:hypothetical protein